MLFSVAAALAQDADPDLAVRAADSQIVSACVDKLPIGSSKPVSYMWTDVCSNPDKNHPKGVSWSDQIRYVISRQADGLHISTSMRMNIEPKSTNAKRAAFMLEKSKACISDLNHYWSRYGISLDIDVDSDRKKTVPLPDYELSLSDSSGRSHSHTHYFNGLDTKQAVIPGVPSILINSGPYQGCLTTCKFGRQFLSNSKPCPEVCEPIRQQEFCLMVLHEVGHLLGLKDEYADPACPAREYVSNESNPWSVMAAPAFGYLDNIALLNNQNILGLSGVEFFPRHIHTIVDRLCPPSAPSPTPTATPACGQQGGTPANASAPDACPVIQSAPTSPLPDPQLIKTLINH